MTVNDWQEPLSKLWDEAYRRGFEDGKAQVLEQEPCDDCISRQAVWDVMQELWGTSGELIDRLMDLPSVTTAEKVGHWIITGTEPTVYKCSECGEICCCQGRYCNECGAKMQEVDK